MEKQLQFILFKKIMEKYYLAVDGGGTKTNVICADNKGAVIGKGLSGPTNLTTTSVGAASFNLIEAVRQSVENLPEDPNREYESLVMGLAGLDSKKEYNTAFEIFKRSLNHYRIKKFLLVNDSVIALENGSSSQNAIILISGTGSICFGRNDQGKTSKSSGMDFLLTDQGSGYAIGRRVLREAVKSYDGRRSKSVLENLVLDYYKIPSIPDLKNEVYNPLLTKIEVADLAYLCSKAMEQDDPAAKHIFDRTIEEIVDMVEAVIKNLGFENEKFDCVFSGSVTKLDYIQSNINRILLDKYPKILPIFPAEEPVLGALKMAMRNEE